MNSEIQPLAPYRHSEGGVALAILMAVVPPLLIIGLIVLYARLHGAF